MFIDSHVTLCDPGGGVGPVQPTATLDHLFGLLRSHGGVGAVLVQPRRLGTDHRHLLANLRRSPLRLRGVACVDDQVLPQTLRDWHAAGVRGVRFDLTGGAPLPDLGTPRWLPLIDTMSELGWHLELHVEPERLRPCLARLSSTGLPLIVDHLARVDDLHAQKVVSALCSLAQRQPVHVKVSAPYRWNVSDAGGTVARFADALGAARLLWGSDWPWPRREDSYQQALRVLDHLGADERPQVCFDNSARLYGFHE